MESMNRHQPGDKVEVVVKRDGKEVTLPSRLAVVPAGPRAPSRVIVAFGRERPAPDSDPMSNLVIPGGRRSLLAGLVALGAARHQLRRAATGPVRTACSSPRPGRQATAAVWKPRFRAGSRRHSDNLEHRLDPARMADRSSPATTWFGWCSARGPPDVLLGGSLVAATASRSAIRATIRFSLAWALRAARRWRLATRDTPAWFEPRRRSIASASLPAGARQDRERSAAPRAETSPDASFPPRRIEYLAIPRTARDPDLAQGFLRFLAENAASELEAPRTDGTGAGVDPDLDSLVADLLGATLVDAQDELWAAWRSLERAGYPDRPANG